MHNLEVRKTEQDTHILWYQTPMHGAHFGKSILMFSILNRTLWLSSAPQRVSLNPYCARSPRPVWLPELSGLIGISRAGSQRPRRREESCNESSLPKRIERIKLSPPVDDDHHSTTNSGEVNIATMMNGHHHHHHKAVYFAPMMANDMRLGFTDKRNRNPNWTDNEISRFLEILQEEKVLKDLMAQRNKQVRRGNKLDIRKLDFLRSPLLYNKGVLLCGPTDDHRRVGENMGPMPDQVEEPKVSISLRQGPHPQY
jgi:hypothetical protein